MLNNSQFCLPPQMGFNHDNQNQSYSMVNSSQLVNNQNYAPKNLLSY